MTLSAPGCCAVYVAALAGSPQAAYSAPLLR